MVSMVGQHKPTVATILAKTSVRAEIMSFNKIRGRKPNINHIHLQHQTLSRQANILLLFTQDGSVEVVSTVQFNNSTKVRDNCGSGSNISGWNLLRSSGMSVDLKPQIRLDLNNAFMFSIEWCSRGSAVRTWVLRWTFGD